MWDYALCCWFSHTVRCKLRGPCIGPSNTLVILWERCGPDFSNFPNNLFIARPPSRISMNVRSCVDSLLLDIFQETSSGPNFFQHRKNVVGGPYSLCVFGVGSPFVTTVSECLQKLVQFFVGCNKKGLGLLLTSTANLPVQIHVCLICTICYAQLCFIILVALPFGLFQRRR